MKYAGAVTELLRTPTQTKLQRVADFWFQVGVTDGGVWRICCEIGDAAIDLARRWCTKPMRILRKGVQYR
jgi:hypothetical protein